MHLYGLKLFKFSIDDEMKRYNWYRSIFLLYILPRIPVLPPKGPFLKKTHFQEFYRQDVLFPKSLLFYSLQIFGLKIPDSQLLWLEIKNFPQISSNQFAVLKFSNKNVTNLSTLWVVISGFSRKLEGFSI